MESMGLVIALRMLTCPFMSLRLKVCYFPQCRLLLVRRLLRLLPHVRAQGLSDIKDMLERVQARDVRSVAPQRTYNVYGRGNVYGYSAVPVIKPTVWLTGDIFAAWLRDNQARSLLFPYPGLIRSDHTLTPDS